MIHARANYNRGYIYATSGPNAGRIVGIKGMPATNFYPIAPPNFQAGMPWIWSLKKCSDNPSYLYQYYTTQDFSPYLTKYSKLGINTSENIAYKIGIYLGMDDAVSISNGWPIGNEYDGSPVDIHNVDRSLIFNTCQSCKTYPTVFDPNTYHKYGITFSYNGNPPEIVDSNGNVFNEGFYLVNYGGNNAYSTSAGVFSVQLVYGPPYVINVVSMSTQQTWQLNYINLYTPMTSYVLNPNYPDTTAEVSRAV